MSDNAVKFPGHAGIDRDYYPGHDRMRWLKKNTNLEWVGYYLPVNVKSGSHDYTSSSRSSWVGSYPVLSAMGWGVVPIYVGKQHFGEAIVEISALPEPDRTKRLIQDGQQDGKEAQLLAKQAGFQPPRVIYFDIENPWNPKLKTRPHYLVYLKAWLDTIKNEGYLPGFYCSPSLVADIETIDPSAQLWVAEYAFQHVKEVVKKNGKKVKELVQENLAEKYPYGIYPTPNPGTRNAQSWQFYGNSLIVAHSLGADGTVHKEKDLLKIDLNTSVWEDPGSPKPDTRILHFLRQHPSSANDRAFEKAGGHRHPTLGHLRPDYAHSGDPLPHLRDSGRFTPEFRKKHGLP